MKISKRVREQAAMICAIAASTVLEQSDAWESIGVPRNGSAAQLIWSAIESLRPDWKPCIPPWAEVYAEAESMLRTGWTNGDET